MNIKLIKIGKTKEVYKEICLAYQKRLKSLCSLDIVYLKDYSAFNKFLKKEAGLTLILCDERGQSYDSMAFSAFLMDKLAGSRSVALVIGDAYGFPTQFREKVPHLLSLSSLVLANEVAWLVLNEQIYRAFMIKTGHAYHHGDTEN